MIIKNKSICKAGSIVLALAMAMSGTTAPASADAATKVPALSSKEGNIVKGKKKKISIKNIKEKNVKKLTIKSKNKKIATVKKVSNIKFSVTGKKIGKTKVTVTLVLKKKVAQKKKYRFTYTANIVKKASTPPIVASSEDPVASSSPSDEPSASPSDEPSASPANIEIASVKAKSASVIEVMFKENVDTSGVSIKLTKGSASVSTKLTWDDDKTAILTSESKLNAGTYTVTASSDSSSSKSSKTVEIEEQYVKEIVIKNDTALTKAGDKKIAYVYYDVLDQYGESMRQTANINWSGNFDVTIKKSNGQLSLKKTTGDNWTVGESIFISGIYIKKAINVQKTLKVGQEQVLNSIDMKGFVKKGSTEFLKTLPADFKAGTYYLVYNALDQNGSILDVPASYDANGKTVTFLTDNALVIQEIAAPERNGIIIGDAAYEAAFVTPGIRVATGGTVTITALANKTGNKTELKVNIGADTLVTSFTLDTPAKVVADGDSDVEIPFEAKDAEGNVITDFVTLAKQETFNAITLNASEGTLTLAEQTDGSAKLIWSDAADYREGWGPLTTDGIDRSVMISVVVVGGNTASKMLTVSDKRRPDAIVDVNVDNVFTENADITFANTHSKTTDKNTGEFKYKDQYGETIGTKWGDDNGFFGAAKRGLTGNEFSGYKFGIKVSYSGPGRVNPSVATEGVITGTSRNTFVLSEGASEEYTTAGNITSVSTGGGFKFEIAKCKSTNAESADNFEAISTAKYHPIDVVDLTQIKSFKIADLNKFYTGSFYGQTGDGVYGGTASNLKSASEEFAANSGIPQDNQQEIVVTGEYNGNTVTISPSYYKVSANKLATASGSFGNEGAFNENKVTKVLLYATNDVSTTKNGLAPSDLYDKYSAAGTSKDAKDTIKVSLYTDGGDLYDTATKSVTISDQSPKAAKIDGLKNSYTISADATAITPSTLNEAFGDIKVLDQYGVKMNNVDVDDIQRKVDKITESKTGYVDDNFKAYFNDSEDLDILGAERADTFELTLKYDNATGTADITVGVDIAASISSVDGNNYLNNLQMVLEGQRKLSIGA